MENARILELFVNITYPPLQDAFEVDLFIKGEQVWNCSGERKKEEYTEEDRKDIGEERGV